jgi:hypothetical protein
VRRGSCGAFLCALLRRARLLPLRDDEIFNDESTYHDYAWGFDEDCIFAKCAWASTWISPFDIRTAIFLRFRACMHVCLSGHRLDLSWKTIFPATRAEQEMRQRYISVVIYHFALGHLGDFRRQLSCFPS